MAGGGSARTYALQPAEPPRQPEPATAQAPSGPVRVTQVTGRVEVRGSADEPWQAAAVDMVLPATTQLRLTSGAVLEVVNEEGKTFTIRRIGGGFTIAQAMPKPAGELPIRVTKVVGYVQARQTEDQPWAKVEVGMTYREGAEFRTMPKTSVEFMIGDNKTAMLDRLGKLQVIEANRQETGKEKTDLGMSYGRTGYNVEAAGEESENTVRTPSATLAIRGTKVIVGDEAGFDPYIFVADGRGLSSFSGAERLAAEISGPAKQATVTASTPNSAETALMETALAPSSEAALDTDAERELLAKHPVYADFAETGVLTFLQQANALGGISGGGIGVEEIMRELILQVDWSNGGPFSDVDLTVRTPAGDIVTFANTIGNESSPSGGVHSGNMVADGPGNGFENVIFANAPSGVYTITVKVVNAPIQSADVFISAIQDLNPIVVDQPDFGNVQAGGQLQTTVTVPQDPIGN